MKKHNIVGNSKGYSDRIMASYSSVTPEKVRKYFLNSYKFVNLYKEGETGYTVNQRMAEWLRMAEIRKSHRGPAQFEEDHSKKAYNRHRM